MKDLQAILESCAMCGAEKSDQLINHKLPCFGNYSFARKSERQCNDCPYLSACTYTGTSRISLQSKGEHPAPCARHCEEKAFEITIKNLAHVIEQFQKENQELRDALNHEILRNAAWKN